MPNSTQTEVLVVGAGPVGMLTALLLAGHGLRTRIIDQESRTAAHSYACVLHPASLCLLERAGIAEDVIDLGRRIETVGFYEGPTLRFRLKLSDLPGRYSFAVVLEQSMLENLLEQRLRGAGSRVLWNHRLLEIEPGANGVDACIENLGSSNRDDSIPESETNPKDRLKIHADFVVGADGHNSTLRQQLDIPPVRAGAPELFAIYEVETVDPLDHEMKLVLNKSAMSVMWPLTENKCRWSFQVASRAAAARFPQKDRHRLTSGRTRRELDRMDYLHRFLAERAPWFQPGNCGDIIWAAQAQFERQLALEFGRGRCWLAGDAAHQTCPAGMQSMNLGLVEGADLAGILKSILRDKAQLDLLQTYDRVHRAEWKHLLGLNEPNQPLNAFSSWVRQRFANILGLKKPAGPSRSLPSWARRHFAVILRSLPASGDDLSHLLEKLKMIDRSKKSVTR